MGLEAYKLAYTLRCFLTRLALLSQLQSSARPAMALTHRLLMVFLGAATLPLLFFSRAEGAGEVGVNYGRIATDITKDQGAVVDLLKKNGITKVRIYDAFDQVLKSLANTGIKVMVMMPDDKIPAAANDPSSALQWVQTNVKPYYPATMIDGVAVGNEVFDLAPSSTPQLVPAMTNVQAALAQLGLADAIKVSTPVAFDALTDTYPPSSGRFTNEGVMKPMLDFLQRTGSYLTMNIYPYFAYVADPSHIPLDYALGSAKTGVVADGHTYTSLLDAQLDATYHAMEKLGFPSLAVRLGETGHPSGGTPTKGKPPGGGGRRRLLDDGGDSAASIPNAQAYNNYVINRVLAGKTGTPYRPNADMDVYIFALFNENNKSTDTNSIEGHFGLFDPETMQKVYPFDFRNGGPVPGPAPPAPMSWCVANAAVGSDRLQAAIDYACGNGADCSAIQADGSCFLPDTKLAHASYAVNSYYQKQGRVSQACDFNGAASVVYQEPANTCRSTAASWCVANTAVGDARLQTALDYACANGADCSAIQPGASCYQPNTVAAHASYAFDSYYQRKGRASGTCDFSGAATIVYQQPSGTCSATAAAASWCVASAGVSDDRLQTALDYACGNGADCSAIQAGGNCFDPNTKPAHASYAFNSYYQKKARASGTCDFSGAASVVYQQPKYGNCVLPSTG